MVKVKISQFLRGTKKDNEVQLSHCHLTVGKVHTFATGTTDAIAQSAARKLLGVHVYALPKADALKHKPLSVGLPEHYRLAQ